MSLKHEILRFAQNDKKIMHLSNIQFSKLVLVCMNEREDGRACCAQKMSPDFYHALKIAVAGMDPTIRVSKTGCLGNCSSGATIAIMPKNVYLGGVKEKDIPEILEILK